MNYQQLIESINNYVKFDFSRFGDGEWNCIFQDTKRRVNCDQHQYFPAMGEALLKVLEDQPDYVIGLQSMAHRQRPEQIDAMTERLELNWCNSNILHHASIKGNLPMLFFSLAGRDVVIVGPEHFRDFKEFKFRHIQIPKKDCWLHYDEIKQQISEILTPDVIILYCASMMANVLIHDFRGQCTQIDAGSVFDPYCNVKSRRYHNDLKI